MYVHIRLYCLYTAGATGSIPVPPTIQNKDFADSLSVAAAYLGQWVTWIRAGGAFCRLLRESEAYAFREIPETTPYGRGSLLARQ